jgi:hypothetical protein
MPLKVMKVEGKGNWSVRDQFEIRWKKKKLFSPQTKFAQLLIIQTEQMSITLWEKDKTECCDLL